MMVPDGFDLDLGDGHWLKFTRWKPDRDLNPQYKDLPDMDKLGGILIHVKKAELQCLADDGNFCEGTILFDSEVVRRVFPRHPMWTVESWKPLTCSPSFLCHCGDHGFIKQGKWVRA